MSSRLPEGRTFACDNVGEKQSESLSFQLISHAGEDEWKPAFAALLSSMAFETIKESEL
jgi:hypothetical protein